MTNKYNTIRIYSDLKEMVGIGEEWLVDKNGDIIAIFWDGNFKQYLDNPVNCQEITQIAA